MFWPFKKKSEAEPVGIVAGSWWQGAWYVENVLGLRVGGMSDWFYIHDEFDIRGRSLRPGQVHYVGTFYERDDLEQIAQRIQVITRKTVKR